MPAVGSAARASRRAIWGGSQPALFEGERLIVCPGVEFVANRPDHLAEATAGIKLSSAASLPVLAPMHAAWR